MLFWFWSFGQPNGYTSRQKKQTQWNCINGNDGQPWIKLLQWSTLPLWLFLYSWTIYICSIILIYSIWKCKYHNNGYGDYITNFHWDSTNFKMANDKTNTEWEFLIWSFCVHCVSISLFANASIFCTRKIIPNRKFCLLRRFVHFESIPKISINTYTHTQRRRYRESERNKTCRIVLLFT